MELYTLDDARFSPLGQVVRDFSTEELLEALKKTPLPTEGVDYVPSEPLLEQLSAAHQVEESLFGGMPAELGWCNGRNTKLNCLEYHRDSEFDLAADDLILLLAPRQKITDGCLDTAEVQAFLVPAGTMVELYATTLHFAPCQAQVDKGVRMMVALAKGTNEPLAAPVYPQTEEDRLLWARNKWLIAHPEAQEAGQGAWVGLRGENIDVTELLRP